MRSASAYEDPKPVRNSFTTVARVSLKINTEEDPISYSTSKALENSGHGVSLIDQQI